MSNHPYSSHNGSIIKEIEFSFRSGTEGPRYDPYGWNEICAEKNGKVYVLHMGLAQWLSIDGTHQQDIPFDDVSSKFEEIIGMKIEDIMQQNYSERSRCPKCGCEELENQDGYPGEHFVVCSKCKEIVDTIFHESEII